MTPNNFKALTLTNEWAYGQAVTLNQKGEFTLINFETHTNPLIKVETASRNTGYMDENQTPIYNKDIILKDDKLFAVYNDFAENTDVLANFEQQIPLSKDFINNGVVIGNIGEILLVNLTSAEEYKNIITKLTKGDVNHENN
ncbi:MAG: YopX family protein [Firmicutes bacterium]|nr:YopX family protein [Bacillota bacterium]